MRRLSRGGGVSGRPTRLFFDARYIRTDFHDGISRFSAELAAAAADAAGDVDVDVVFLIHDEEQRRRLPSGARTLRIHSPTSWREPFSSLILSRHRPDVLFSPMQTIGSLGRRFGLILTLHDTIYYRHRTPPRDLPGLVRIGWRLFHLSYLPQRLVLDAADLVATVSETSKRQFAAVGLTKRPVLVLANAPQRLEELLPTGVGAASSASGRSARPPRNIVYMGSFMPYKNVETLVLAMRHLPDHTLHLLSRIGEARRRELEAMVPDGASVVFHGGVSDEEYAEILSERALLATLSLDEGYGLPIAEALAFGVPAVVSESEIFHEVAGEGALYVAPQDPEAFAGAVRSLDDDELRAQVVAAGTAHAAEYSWEKSATRLLAAVRDLAGAD
ncbi:glycosyltransferase family 4 protein [Leucobacter weissii]|uniref:Glycosyltransferase family 4 protein n=1 Tax=Leucobacter weissii TaxID=1983706 RepID=A0A939MKE9_9MICO|nr:glycosyltransferase family 1 protein [Leucobacter weissii]MBO1900452.1 glycosyltransferase family 4 protein [Leucobacter weissii]